MAQNETGDFKKGVLVGMIILAAFYETARKHERLDGDKMVFSSLKEVYAWIHKEYATKKVLPYFPNGIPKELFQIAESIFETNYPQNFPLK